MRRSDLVTVLVLAACTGTDPADPDGDGVEAPTGERPVKDDAPEDTGGDTAAGGGDDSGAGGAGGAIPVEVDGRWEFVAADLRVTIDPAVGGRIAQVSFGGVDLLTDAAVDPDNWGATFWTSPQSTWSWPPPAAIDAEPYDATVDGDALVLTSASAAVGDTTWVATKRVTVSEALTVTYTLTNTGEDPADIAGWEVARMPADGLTFFPAGNHVTGTLGALSYTEEAGHVWIVDTPSSDAKVIADASGGWIAHVANGVMLVRTFEDVRLGDAAPGEGEVEVFAKGGGGYREVEAQSAYTSVPAGGSLTWTGRWEAALVPADLPVEVGSAGLVTLATETSTP